MAKSLPTNPTVGDCVCRVNSKTKRSIKLCFLGKGKKTRSGWVITSDTDGTCTVNKKSKSSD